MPGVRPLSATSDVRAFTIGALLDARLSSTPNAIACSVRRNDQWHPVTWADAARRLAAARAQLTRLGAVKGRAVAVMAPNSFEWDLVNWAALELGAVVVGLDPNDRPENLQAMLAQVEPTVLAVSELGALARLEPLPPSLSVLTLGDAAPPAAPGRRVEPLATATADGPHAFASTVQPGDLATIIFTSGTTGTPKGIAYTHRQLCLAVHSILEALPDLGPGGRVPCWLPQAHLFQRIINLCAVERGGHLFYVASPLELPKLLPGIAPHVVVGVPRFFEKVWAGIVATLARQPPPLRAVAQWALAVGRAAAAARRAGQIPGWWLRFRLGLAERLVFRTIRRAFGGELRYFISGAAPLPTWLLEELHAVGLLVLEAYGLSENVIPNCINTVAAFRFGSVGRPLAATQVRLDDEGQVQVRGEGVFTGYLGAKGDQPLDAAGWLSTGDLGTFDADGFLWLVGRKSEVVKSSTGRKVALPAIEAVLRRLPWVDLPVVVAAGRAAPLALLYVNPGRLGDGAPRAVLEAAVPRVRREVLAVCDALAGPQRPAGLVLIPRAPSLEAGELTASLKVRRAAIEARYALGLQQVSRLLEGRAPAAIWVDDLEVLAGTL